MGGVLSRLGREGSCEEENRLPRRSAFLVRVALRQGVWVF